MILPVLDPSEPGECRIFYTVPLLIVAFNVRLELRIDYEPT
jgi:hypothetical protein